MNKFKISSWKDRQHLRSKQGQLLAVVLVFGIAGTYFLMSSNAATPASYVAEAEDNTVVSPATTVNDSSASGGSAVKFMAAATGNTWPDATNTGYAPTGVTLHACSTNLVAGTTYDSCQFNGDLNITGACKNSIVITRSLINGQVSVRGPGGYEYTPGNLSPNANCDATGVTISDTTINCGCKSQGVSDSPAAMQGLNFTLLRVNLSNSAHGVAPDQHIDVQDTYIHDLGGNTDAHKDGFYIGDGDHMVIRHNNIECNDGPIAGCTSAVALLNDFSNITFLTLDHNLLNTIGSYCFYGGGGPQKPFVNNTNIVVTNNHFGRKYNQNCGFYGPVTYFNSSGAGNVWTGNVWDDTGASVPPAN